jgi:hypothetical protein
MTRLQPRATLSILLGCLTLFGALGCSFHMRRVNRAIQDYNRSLVLEATLATSSLTIGQDADLALTLRNTRTDRSVAACLGVSRRFLMTAVPFMVRDRRPPVDDAFRTIDHPCCLRRFALAPAEELSWSERIPVPDIGVGDADLKAFVQVVHPKDCERLYGCYDTMIGAKPVRVSLGRQQRDLARGAAQQMDVADGTFLDPLD